MKVGEDEARVVRIALGRIFLLLSRPTQPGDVERYEEARRVVLEFAEPLPEGWDTRANWVRDRLRGAAGD